MTEADISYLVYSTQREAFRASHEEGLQLQFRHPDFKSDEGNAVVLFDLKEYDGLKLGDTVFLRKQALTPDFRLRSDRLPREVENRFDPYDENIYFVIAFVEVMTNIYRRFFKSVYTILATKDEGLKNARICRVPNGQRLKLALYWSGSLQKIAT